ncbi:MBL fold metallo-hydrolase [Pseudodesulfovibrio thermohalotolerans]|uniref:MBL fold metallo-hydrolase n=1 Tax=Pseudodesulfovibrio thermohalotolerans TaxID=2880651 RepID=UPI0022B9DF61|nr:MBL fold metallo-hydrolase [Pseudodesulfovibrio thermohalotolerans]WFS61911.1 MBL fold metallo-hydrolase [Pseudodesulfovibrio thermohalotolerans]
MIFFFVLVVLLVVSGCFYIGHDKFGRLPEGERLDRISESPNFKDGTFHNREPIPEIVEGGGGLGLWLKFLLRDGGGLTPPTPLPVVKTDLKALEPDADVVVWLGHSSYFVQLGGKTILIDPVLSDHASPVSFSTRAFEGTTIYTAEDMPDIDYLLISHDHWDHLDYDTVLALRSKIGHIVTGLGVGEHFARWEFPDKMVVEADWDSEVKLEDGLTIHVLTARHFSGRLFDRNRTLWVSFALETPTRRIFYSGDSGYGSHFKQIGDRFDGFDFVMLDSGQYNDAWRYVHMNPEQAAQAAEDLCAEAALPSHVGRFNISYHSWDDPFRRFVTAGAGKPYQIVTPRIGEAVDLDDPSPSVSPWWELNTKRDNAG